FSIHRTQVAGTEPSFFAGDRLEFFALPVLPGHVLTAHQDFSRFWIKLHLTPGKDLANGSAPNLEWMVQTHQRAGFSQPVALNYAVAQPAPEFFRALVKSGASRNHGPELPPKIAVHFTEAPPSLEELLVFGDLPVLRDGGSQLRLNFRLERLRHPRHRYEYRNAITSDRLNHVSGLVAFLEKDRAPNERRDENPHGLSKHMAQRQHVKKADGVEDALVFAVFGNFALNWINAAEDVAMSQHYAARLRCCAGGEDDLSSIIARQIQWLIDSSRMVRQRLLCILKLNVGSAARFVRQRAGADHQFGADVCRHTARKFRRGNPVHGNSGHAAQHTAKECGYPFRTILAPQHHSIALADVARLQFTRETEGQLRRLAIAPSI